MKIYSPQVTMWGVGHLINRKRRREIQRADQAHWDGGLPVRYEVRRLNRWAKPEMIAVLPSESGWESAAYETTIIK